MKKLVFIFICLSCSGNLFPQITENSYIPLRVGDIYVYKTSNYTGGPVTYSITKNNFTQEMMINGIRYVYSSPLFGGWIRYDSLNHNLVMYWESGGCGNYPYDRVQDSLNSQLNDSVKFCHSYVGKKCTLLENQNFFGQQLSTLRFDYLSPSGPAPRSYITYTKGIGVTSFGSSVFLVYSTSSTLKGCVLNGVLYGDTSSTTGISLISSSIPDKFSLQQNYPNPFNPSTKISYDIKSSGFTTLKVFDLLGKEVAQLVNEKQNAGSYAVDFNSAEFNLPSGIYFYTLSADEFKETRKMVLVK